MQSSLVPLIFYQFQLDQDFFAGFVAVNFEEIGSGTSDIACGTSEIASAFSFMYIKIESFFL